MQRAALVFAATLLSACGSAPPAPESEPERPQRTIPRQPDIRDGRAYFSLADPSHREELVIASYRAVGFAKDLTGGLATLKLFGHLPCAAPSPLRRPPRGSTSASRPTPFATRTRPTCSSSAPTSAPSSSCSVTRR